MGEYTNRLCVVGTDKSEVGDNQEPIDLTVGVFFDGTLNSKYNTKWRFVKDESIDDSYKNDYTNVVKLWRAYKSDNITTYKVYIEGPGTVSPLLLTRNDPSSKEYEQESVAVDKEEERPWVSSQKSDKTLKGGGLGIGSTGVNAKIERACMLVTGAVTRSCQENNRKLKSLTLDVYGFSRGAASARSFVSGIYSLTEQRKSEAGNYWVSLASWLFMYSFTKGATIKVRFLGLFDTVSSYGGIIDDDVAELSLSIPSTNPNVYNVVHLSAADEYREKFPLTNIHSAGKRGREVILPGAHSDIGGGYCRFEKEIMYSKSDNDWRSQRAIEGDHMCRGYKTYDELVDEGWLPEGWNKPLESKEKYYPNVVHYNLFRTVRNDYARIPFYVMYELSNLKGIAYNNMVIDHDSAIRSSDTGLNALKQMILSKVRNNQPLYMRTINKKNQDGLVFIGSQDDLELIKRNRYEFMHLSADGSFLKGEAEDNNIRKIIDDTIMK